MLQYQRDEEEGEEVFQQEEEVNRIKIHQCYFKFSLSIILLPFLWYEEEEGRYDVTFS